MDTVQAVAILSTALVLALVLELVRRRRLVERYALLWMVTAVAMLILALLRDDVLDPIADLLGIASPVNLLFLAGFAVIFVVVLNFTVAISRLSEETKILAQEVGRLEQELRAARGELPGPNGADAAAGSAAEQVERGERG
ncbi:MAG TPA: DUF2304 domain-containing protein [Solirubrobacterales bacterium]|nr:DUF2304 domain-containing protein [Solirubrobacterales bacterium]